jgi:hypothetical protein
MTLPRLYLAQTCQRIEVLQEDLGQGGEVGAPAEAVKAFEETLVSGIEVAARTVPEQTLGGEMIDVPHELFSVEIAQGALSLRIHTRLPIL